MCVAVLTLFAAVPTASASKWYVDGKHGNDNNDCKSRQRACKTISNALLLTLPGDSIFVAPATYHEGLYIPFNLKIFGSGAKTTIVDGGGISRGNTADQRYSNNQSLHDRCLLVPMGGHDGLRAVVAESSRAIQNWFAPCNLLRGRSFAV
jgi:hypothetical protein